MRAVNPSRTPAPGPATLPLAVRHADPSGPLALETSIVAWHRQETAAGGAAGFLCVLGEGLLFDDDKGRFPVAGLELALRRSSSGAFEPGALTNPGVLSEFQQEWLLDAVCSVLNGQATGREPDR